MNDLKDEGRFSHSLNVDDTLDADDASEKAGKKRRLSRGIVILFALLFFIVFLGPMMENEIDKILHGNAVAAYRMVAVAIVLILAVLVNRRLKYEKQ